MRRLAPTIGAMNSQSALRLFTPVLPCTAVAPLRLSLATAIAQQLLHAEVVAMDG
ncbi:MAG: hypothetical protein M5R41_10655 [Bacteroidia bacterium]|nr:hypothetical protein [Bacteroidia bacterium]